jgi:Cysteine rich repeat
MVRLAFAVVCILALASSGANAQNEAQPPGAQNEAQPPGAPEAQPPGEQPPAAQTPATQTPAARPSGVPRWYFACKPDVAQFCGKVRPGGGRLRSCLMERSSKLSPGCNQALIQPRQQQ